MLDFTGFTQGELTQNDMGDKVGDVSNRERSRQQDGIEQGFDHGSGGCLDGVWRVSPEVSAWLPGMVYPPAGIENKVPTRKRGEGVPKP